MTKKRPRTTLTENVQKEMSAKIHECKRKKEWEEKGVGIKKEKNKLEGDQNAGDRARLVNQKIGEGGREDSLGDGEKGG